MREIKFRAWDKLDKCMTVSDYVPNERPSEDDLDVFMQYTGLKDKNGVEIYEGDILTYRDMYSQDKVRVIRWNKLMAKFEAYHNENYTSLDTWFEVIGNIYENPELLETT